MSIDNLNNYLDKRIHKAYFDADSIYLHLADCTLLRVYDGGQGCCEHRYMECQDDLSVLNGQLLKNIIIRSVDNSSDTESGNEHEIAFLEIKTDKDTVSFATHNEHNGYYSGFNIEIDASQLEIPEVKEFQRDLKALIEE